MLSVLRQNKSGSHLVSTVPLFVSQVMKNPFSSFSLQISGMYMKAPFMVCFKSYLNIVPHCYCHLYSQYV